MAAAGVLSIFTYVMWLCQRTRSYPKAGPLRSNSDLDQLPICFWSAFNLVGIASLLNWAVRTYFFLTYFSFSNFSNFIFFSPRIHRYAGSLEYHRQQSSPALHQPSGSLPHKIGYLLLPLLLLPLILSLLLQTATAYILQAYFTLWSPSGGTGTSPSTLLRSLDSILIHTMGSWRCYHNCYCCCSHYCYCWIYHYFCCGFTYLPAL